MASSDSSGPGRRLGQLTTARTPADDGGEPPARMYLAVFQGARSWMCPVAEATEVVIGRDPGCDVELSERAVSRRHATIVVEDGAAWIRDLGSQNGTHVNGERIDGERRLSPGDIVTVCSATLVLHAVGQAVPDRRVVDAAELRRRLDEELERALRHDRSFSAGALLVGPGGDRASVEAAVDRHLDPTDAAAWTGDGELSLIFPETDADDAVQRARRLAGGMPAAVPVRIGVAGFPDDAAAIDALLAATRAAAAAAPAGEVGVAGAARTLEIAGRRVIVADPVMRRLYALIDRIATSELPVLICGETGTGKELAAAAVHHRSNRRGGPLLTLNCAAIQDSLIESELFGHEKGAFSGATAAKPGLLETAGGGTVFLDEIGEISPATQAKLLRVLETRRVMRVGDVRERAIDVRLVAATNRNLVDEVKAGSFRKDLYFRLSGAMLWLPPLRERREELALLARAFLAEACTAAGREPIALTPAAMALLAGYDWPGNVRELKNLMEYAAAAFPDATAIAPEQLADRLLASPPDDRDAAAPAPADRPAAPGQPAPDQFRPLAEELQDLERTRIVQALRAAGGNNTRAARLIDMPIRTFFNKLKRYGLSSDGD